MKKLHFLRFLSAFTLAICSAPLTMSAGLAQSGSQYSKPLQATGEALNILDYRDGDDWAGTIERAAANMPRTGGVLLIPPGEYMLDRTVRLSLPQWSRIEAWGAKFNCRTPDICIMLNAAADWTTVNDITTQRGVWWTGGQLIRTADNQTGTGLYLPRMRTLRIEGLHVTGFENGLSVIGKDTHTFIGNHFYNNRISILYPKGLTDTLPGNAPLGVNILYNNFSIRDMSAAVWMRDKVIGLRFMGNTIAGNTNDSAQVIFDDGPSNRRAESYTIRDNIFEQIGPGGAIALLNSNGHGIRHAVIEDNNFATNEPDSDAVIRLHGARNVRIGVNTLFLANPVQGTNAMSLVHDDGNTDGVWIDWRQHIDGATANIKLMFPGQLAQSPNTHLVPQEVDIEGVGLGGVFDGVQAMPVTGIANVSNRIASSAVHPLLKSGLPPRRARITGLIRVLNNTGAQQSGWIGFGASSREIVQLNGSHFPASGDQTNIFIQVQTWVNLDDTGSFTWIINSLPAGSVFANLRIDAVRY